MAPWLLFVGLLVMFASCYLMWRASDMQAILQAAYGGQWIYALALLRLLLGAGLLAAAPALTHAGLVAALGWLLCLGGLLLVAVPQAAIMALIRRFPLSPLAARLLLLPAAAFGALLAWAAVV